MRIAVTSQDFRTVTGHAGRARRFLIYDVPANGAPSECGRLDLTPEQSIHEAGGAGTHPIDGVDVLLSAGFASHFVLTMAQRGIQAAVTDKIDPIEAVTDYLVRRTAGTLLPIIGCGCSGGCHGDDHTH
jgi:predicted Fe-Mo cluster-binding NifX family protein